MFIIDNLISFSKLSKYIQQINSLKKFSKILTAILDQKKNNLAQTPQNLSFFDSFKSCFKICDSFMDKFYFKNNMEIPASFSKLISFFNAELDLVYNSIIQTKLYLKNYSSFMKFYRIKQYIDKILVPKLGSIISELKLIGEEFF